MPAPDPKALDPDWDVVNQAKAMQPPSYKLIPPWDATPPSGSSAAPKKGTRAVAPTVPGWSCEPADASGVAPCSRIVTSKKDLAALPSHHPSGAQDSPARSLDQSTDFDDIVPWCTEIRGSYLFTRYEACFHYTYEYIAVELSDEGVPVKTIGEADFDMFQQIKLWQKSGLFQQRIKVYPISIDSALASVTLNASVNCLYDDTCSSLPEQWSASLTWTHGDTHTATVIKDHDWTPTSSGAIADPLGLLWAFEGFSPIAGPSATEITDSDTHFTCDNYEIIGTEGCSFDAYHPTYVFNSAKYPAAAAHAWLIQNVLPSHLGSEQYNSPLNYLPDEKNQYGRPTQANRDAVCHGSCSSGFCAGGRLAGSGVGTGTATVIMNVCDDVSGSGGRGGHDSPGCVGQAVRGSDGCDRGLLGPAGDPCHGGGDGHRAAGGGGHAQLLDAG